MFNRAVGLLCGIGGWLLNTMWAAVRSLETKVAAIDVLVAGQYVKKDEMHAFSTEIFRRLDKIHDEIKPNLGWVPIVNAQPPEWSPVD
jgi:hypothetical protein